MKEKITKIAKGIIEYELTKVTLSEEAIEFSIEAGKKYSGSITMSNRDGVYMKGLVYSSSFFMKLKNTAFAGQVVTIEYEYVAVNLNPGETHSGIITIESNLGEFEIPFLATVEMPFFDTTMGKIRDLFQFANLAKADWLQAIKVFKAEEFETVFLSNDRKNRLIYRSLSKSLSASHGLEEFLIAIHKKDRIQFTIDKSFLEYEEVQETFQDKLTIRKDNWGYSEIRITTDSDFIIPEHKILWTDNFIGNQYILEYRMDPSHMHPGKNYGKLFLRTSHQSFTIEIVAYCYKMDGTKRKIRNYHSASLEFTRSYLNFRMNRIAVEQYMLEVNQSIQNFYELHGQEYELLKLHLAIMEENDEKVQTLFGQLREKEEQWKESAPFILCAYWYLNALYQKDHGSIEEARERIEKQYQKKEDCWQLFWFLLYLDQSYEENPEKKKRAILQNLKKGSKSSVLYLELANLYRMDAGLLHELNRETIQVLNWMVKENYITDEIIERYVYLAGRMKGFHLVVFRNMKQLFEREENDEILHTICTMLIKAQKAAVKYNRWFARGVEKQLRITQLYEFYMDSVEENLFYIFPQAVLLYFSFQSNLNERKAAFLYANMIYNKEQYGDIYLQYEKKIKEFAICQLEKRAVNEFLAIIYEELINKDTICKEYAVYLPYVMFRHEIQCHNANMVGVVVCHKELTEEIYVPLEDGKAYIHIFTENSNVFLVDSRENRYCTTVEFTLNKLLHLDELADYCMPYAADNGMLLLHLYEQMESYHKYAQNAVSMRKKLLLMEELEDNFRNHCIVKLASYFYDSMQGDELDSLLQTIDFHKVSSQDRVKLMELCMLRDIDDNMLELLAQYGYENNSMKKLVRFLKKYIQKQEEPNKLIVNMAYDTVRMGKHNQEIVEYAAKHFNGTTKEMKQLWDAGRIYSVDMLLLEEMYLSQCLFTEKCKSQSVDVFLSYYKKPERNKILVQSFLNYFAYKYMVKERLIPDSLFSVMEQELQFEENQILLIAVLKYKSTLHQLNSQELEFVDVHLSGLARKGIVFSFFKEFQKVMHIPHCIANKYFVEYRTNPNNKVMIHYTIESDTSDGMKFRQEEMKDMCYGIFVKEFILFHNERLMYYITEDDGMEETITESIHVQYEQDFSSEDNKFSFLNLMLMAREVQDSKTVMELMRQYLETEAIVAQMFQPLE
ncbi:DUF5717 family protein [Anaeromicropila populeti]|uniref:DUF5717 domain-containing protein n=1 Tax=Anaeromicropila populeti TaxID=37658 RepID=A0A1I6KLB5_9FIRM|nr:DUF5717 family protein [Anaeromicropila populeti]SFR92001.1 hypothetical protein SAMN05661086_02509 [Anaeromicropila populeti]